MSSFYQALQELQGSPLLAQAGVSVTAAEDTAGGELMAVATAAVAAVATVEQHMQRYADGTGWHGRSLEVHAFGFVAFGLSRVLLLQCWQERNRYMLRLSKFVRLHMQGLGLLDGCWQQDGMLPGSNTLLLVLPSSSAGTSNTVPCRCKCSVLMSQPGLLSDKCKCM